MWHFDGENKPGFAKYTRSVYSVYTRRIPAKIYCIEREPFGWLFRGKKNKRVLIAKFAAP